MTINDTDSAHLATSLFNWPCRVYYEDTDAQGLLYHARCLHYFERCRTEWVRSLGVSQKELLQQDRAFVVVEANLAYRSVAKFDDILFASLAVQERKRTQLKLKQLLVREQDQQVVVAAEFRLAFISLSDTKLKALPDCLG